MAAYQARDAHRHPGWLTSRESAQSRVSGSTSSGNRLWVRHATAPGMVSTNPCEIEMQRGVAVPLESLTAQGTGVAAILKLMCRAVCIKIVP